MLSIFSCACWQPVCLLWRNVYLGLLPIFRLGCLFLCYWVVWAVCIFWKLSPCQLHQFANIFSQSIGCLFVLFMVSFAVQKLVSLIRSHLFIFAFISLALADWPKKTVWFMSENVLLMFSSRSFMVSCLIFKSSSHSEFIFVYGVRVCSNFTDLHVAVQLSQHHLLKRLSFLHCIFLPPLSKINWWQVMWVYCWALYCVFHWFKCLFLCQYHTVLITVAL